MRILIAGGRGFLGRRLSQSLLEDGHEVWVLTRRSLTEGEAESGLRHLLWDGRSCDEWAEAINEMDAVVNLSGESIGRWPWSAHQKQRLRDSRLQPGEALVEAIRRARKRPAVFLQVSGVNHYGTQGEEASEATPPGDDFLARLTCDWEASTQPVEELGLRRVVARLAVVLAASGGMLPRLALPVRLGLGGPIGGGRQAMPWIHEADAVGAMRFLIENPAARGPFNLVAPHRITNAEFLRLLARALRRPFWLPVPSFLLRLTLGEMSVLVLEGRPVWPKRLLELGYHFRFERLEEALQAIYPRR
jgi:uncharacterized protein (TIGR01777 family)